MAVIHIKSTCIVLLGRYFKRMYVINIMLTWLFKRNIFSPTISDLPIFLLKKCSRQKIGDVKFYLLLHHIILVYVQIR